MSDKKVFGNYRLLEEIAEGGFGKTYKAEHVLLGMPVCFKHAGNISADDEQVIKDEARAMWELRHFGIPAIRDILELEDGSFALIMSYIPGPTLMEVVEKNQNNLDAEHVAWIAARVLNILKYIHFHGVVHGDVKPQNIIIQPDKHSVVLVDYGLSMIKPRKTHIPKGYTRYFASPEAIRGEVLLPESDFYSLAMTMIYALGGDIIKRQVPATTPDALCEFIKRLMVLDVLNRPNWQKEDLEDSLIKVREKDFSRSYSGMKKLKF